MTPDEALRTETRAWLEKSGEDLQAARALIDAGLAAPALFHCQQVAEAELGLITAQAGYREVVARLPGAAGV
jgi:HEPN domain-containing protein